MNILFDREVCVRNVGYKCSVEFVQGSRRLILDLTPHRRADRRHRCGEKNVVGFNPFYNSVNILLQFTVLLHVDVSPHYGL
jgi:hypothetical protein